MPDLATLMRRVLPTEVHAIVEREDEQALAELDAARPVFMKDAVRLMAGALEAESRVGDFGVAASHGESLHAHDAVTVLTGRATFAAPALDPWALGTLVPRG